MRAPFAAAMILAFLVAGCDMLTLGNTDAGTAATTTDDGGTDAGAVGIIGADCTAVGTGVSLCAAVSVCPDIELDPRLFPHCGFRVSGTAIDLECYCTGILCPIGLATSCTDIAQLVLDQDEDSVCAKEGLGECTSLGGTVDGGSTSTSCNPACTDGCGNTPACYQACGC